MVQKFAVGAPSGNLLRLLFLLEELFPEDKVMEPITCLISYISAGQH